MTSESRLTTSKKSTKNINENLFDETIMVQVDRKRCSAGVVSIGTQTSIMNDNLDKNNKHCCGWTERMSEQYNGDFVRSDESNKGNDMIKTFLDGDRRIILTDKRSVPDEENVLEGTAVVKDDLLTVEHLKPTSDVNMIMSSTQKSLNAASKGIRPSHMTIPLWKVIWFLVIFTVLMLNIKHEILLRRSTKDDSLLEKFPARDAVDRRIPPLWSMLDEEGRSPKRNGNDEETSRQKVIGETTFAINAAQCEDILQYCRVHGKGSTAKNVV